MAKISKYLIPFKWEQLDATYSATRQGEGLNSAKQMCVKWVHAHYISFLWAPEQKRKQTHSAIWIHVSDMS